MELARACRSVFQLVMLMTIFVKRKAIEGTLKEDSDDDDDDDAEIGDSLNLADDGGAFIVLPNFQVSFLLLTPLLSTSLAPARKIYMQNKTSWTKTQNTSKFSSRKVPVCVKRTAWGPELLAGAKNEEKDSDDDEEIDEEPGYISFLETVDPYVQFKRVLTSKCLFLSSLFFYFYVRFMVQMIDVHFSLVTDSQMKSPAVCQASATSLNIEHQAVLMKVMFIAEENTAAAGVAAAPVPA
jgi:hypothetical protein